MISARVRRSSFFCCTNGSKRAKIRSRSSKCARRTQNAIFFTGWLSPAGCELAGCELAGCELAGCELAGCELAGCELAGCAGSICAGSTDAGGSLG
ncbi:MAG: pentapeptide repeat-containing protein [Pirellula sp.]